MFPAQTQAPVLQHVWPVFEGGRRARFGVVLLGLCGIIVLPAFQVLPVRGLEPYDAHRLVQVGVLVAGALAMVAHRELRQEAAKSWRRLPGWARLGLLAVGGLGLASALQAAVPVMALLEWGHLVLLWLLALLVAAAFRGWGERGDRLLLAVVLISAGCYLLRFGATTLVHLGWGLPAWPESGLGFSHPRFFNQYQSWVLPLLVVPLIWRGASVWLKRGALLATVCFWMLLFGTGGRGTLVALGLAGLTLALLMGRPGRRWLFVQLGAAGAGLLLFLAGHAQGWIASGGLLARNVLTDSGRLAMWRHAWELMEQHPWLGVGPMHFAYAPYGSGLAHPHSVLFQWLAEWGVPATLVLGALVMIGMLHWLGYARRRVRHAGTDFEGAMRVGLTASLVAGSTHALISGVVVMPVSQLLLAVIIGRLLAELPAHRTEQQPTWSRRGIALAAVVGLLAMAPALIRDLSALTERKEQYFEATGSLRLSPRYWQQGRFGYEASAFQMASERKE